MTQWKPFPQDNARCIYNARFSYKGEKLKNTWAELHGGNCVQFPDSQWVACQLDEHPQAAPTDFAGDVSGLTNWALMQRWQN